MKKWLGFRALSASILIGCVLAAQPVSSQSARQTAAQSCKPVQDINDFVSAWNDAVIGPGSRSHVCTLRMLTPDARITGVVMGKDGKSSRVVESPAEFVGWYQQRPNEMFWERTTHSTVEVYENVARITRTYEVRASATSPVVSTGIEDFQLILDGGEWKAFSLLWQDASQGKPLPVRYTRDAN